MLFIFLGDRIAVLVSKGPFHTPMNQTDTPFLQSEKSLAGATSEKSSTGTTVAAVTAVAASMVYLLIFSGFAFVDYAETVVRPERMQALLAARLAA
jgi:hypothetical protein